jgi:proteasome lid subunit RPN8/RPN11
VTLDPSHLGDSLRYLAAEIREYAKAADHPGELCGYLLYTGTELVVFPVRNLAEAPDRFIMDPTGRIGAAQIGAIVATWHTHPDNGIPSDADREARRVSSVAMIIIGMNGDIGWLY